MRARPPLTLAAIVILLTAGFPLPAGAEDLGTWNRTTSYPLAFGGEACVTSGGYIYCVGGISGTFPPDYTNRTYYAPLTATGIGSWSSTTDYPKKISNEACVTQGSYIYCIGGQSPGPDRFGVAVNSSYYASLSGSGIGAWVGTTSYPKALATIMCVASSGYVYCVGGHAKFGDPMTGVNETYYATTSGVGVGPWQQTTTIPIRGQLAAWQTCVSENGYLYCGYFYAPISASGIGAWIPNRTPGSGIGLNTSCVVDSGYVYCVGRNQNSTNAGYARDMNPGLTPFLKAADYPLVVDFSFSQYACTVDSGRIYCVGGQTCTSFGPPRPMGCVWTDAVYFADVVPSRTVTIYILCCKGINSTYFLGSSYFYPQNVTLVVGLNNTVRWYNGIDPVNVTAKDGSSDTGTIMRFNLSNPITLAIPGLHSYHIPTGRGAGSCPFGPGVGPCGEGTINVVQALIVTTTKVYTLTTITTSATTATVATTSIVTVTATSTGGAAGIGLEIVAITSVAVAFVVGLLVGSKRKGRAN